MMQKKNQWIKKHLLEVEPNQSGAVSATVSRSGDLPFTFVYDGRPSGEVLASCPKKKEKKELAAWQFDRPDLGEGMVQVFRRLECPETVQQYKLHGLKPEGVYIVVDLDDNRQKDLSGRSLMETGLNVSIPSRPGAKVITYKLQERALT